jgi:LytS/YehU family sensor histidine kinase
MATKYLVKFSQLVRNILNHSSSSYISLKEELNTIELYMHIEGMRFNNQFSYLIDIEPDIYPSNILIPSLLLQPYVENAIWHGLLHKEGEKNITIRVRKDSMETVCIEIEDNGVGRAMAEEIEQKPQQRKSFGMQLGENRLKLMNNGHGVVSSVNVIDKVNELGQPNGTIIRIIIPTNIFKEEKISLN